MFASTCALSRWDSELQARARNGEKQPLDFTVPEYFLRKSIRHAKELLAKPEFQQALKAAEAEVATKK